MSHPDVGQGPQATGSEEAASVTHSKQDRPSGPEMGGQPGNGTQQIVGNQAPNTHMMKQGPGPTQMPQHTGASPQQQLPTQPQQGGPMPGLHFPSVPTTSQSSRPKTPNRASPRPYHHPLTPTNRPPSTEPSEINLSPERLNASIAGLFPPKINIPLPPRQPNLNRGFDQQGLNPTTLKAIGQAPPGLTLPGNNNNGSAGGNNTNNNQQPFSAGTGAGIVGAKQDKPVGVQGKRASPSNSRRSSPASSRKSATPSPGRQKGTKAAVTGPPHQQQQQLVNPQGQTMMLSPTSIPPSPVSMPSQVSGCMEAQQTQSTLHGIQGNPADGVRDSQGMITAEQRQMPHSQPQPLRELSAPRMTSPRLPAPQQPKTDLEQQAGTDRQLTHSASVQDSEVSPALRAAPTSLNQLLDNTGVPNMSLRPIQSGIVRDAMGKDSPKSAFDPERPLHSNSQSTDVTVSVANTSETEAKLKPVVSVPISSPNLQPVSVSSSLPPNNLNSSTAPSLNQNPVSNLGVIPSSNVNPTPGLCSSASTNTNVVTSMNSSIVSSSQSSSGSTVSGSSAVNSTGSALKPSPSPKTVTSVHSVIQLPASSSTISPNQITVFVASNPITSASTSQPPTSMVSTMMAVPHRNIRPQDIRQQSSAPRPPQFITTTPVFINPIFQVSNASVAPNSTVVSQSVTMVGSIQVSNTNIQLSPVSSSTQSSGANMTSTQSTRNAVGQVQVATSMSSSNPASLVAAQQNNPSANKTESPGETSSNQKSLPVPQPSHPSPSASSPFQPPLASPPPCSSPGAVNTVRKSPVSSSPTAQLRSKPAQAAVAVSVTADSQQSPVERPAQGHTGAVPPQAFHPPASPAIQTEAQAPHTSVVPPNIINMPAVSSPVTVPSQVTAPTQIVGQAPVHAPTSVSTPTQAVTSQAPVMAVVGTSTGVSSSAALSTVPLVQSPLPSIVPALATPGSVQEGPQATSSPAANPSGVPPGQSDSAAAAEPSIPSAAAAAETTQTTAGKHAAVSFMNF